MADVKVVIKISEDDYWWIKQASKGTMCYPTTLRMYDAIKNGTLYETVTEFADRCRECGAKYGKLLKQELTIDKGRKSKKQALLDALAKEDEQVLALAYVHAQYLNMYGIDIEKALCTATENAEAMNKAYQKAYHDAMMRSLEVKREDKE